jgi:hypothetical protein
MKRFACVALMVLVGCSTSVSLKNPDGTTMSGSLTNGSMSYSSGPGCHPATPNSATAIPVLPTAFKMVQTSPGIFMAVPDATTCVTQLAVVQGTDITSYFGWIFAALGAAAIAVASGT